MIGLRVRQVRDLLGLTQVQLAEKAQIDQSVISRIEGGADAKPVVIEAIAAATGYPVAWFERPFDEFPDGTVRFRKKAGTSQRADRQARRRLEVAHELVSLLLDGSGARLPEVRLPVLPRPDRDTELIDFVEDAAQQIRDRLGLPARGPVPNLLRALERAGALVVALPVDLAGHDGLSVWIDPATDRPVLGFRNDVPGDRQRFTLAHETAHLVLHRLDSVDPSTAEDEANKFAGALLVPRPDALQALHPAITLTELARLKKNWGVAIQALIMRGAALGVIPPERQTSLWKQLSARGWRKNEPVIVHREQPALLNRLVESLHGDESVRVVAGRLDFPTHLFSDMVSTGRRDNPDGGEVVPLRRLARG